MRSFGVVPDTLNQFSLSPLSSESTFKEKTTWRQHNTEIPFAVCRSRQQNLRASLSTAGKPTTFALGVAKRNSNNTRSNMRTNREKRNVIAQGFKQLYVSTNPLPTMVGNPEFAVSPLAQHSLLPDGCLHRSEDTGCRRLCTSRPLSFSGRQRHCSGT